MAMNLRLTPREISQFHRTLAGLVVSYEGESAVLDLVNESSVAGRIDQVDA